MVFDATGNTIIEVDDGGIYRRTSPRANNGDWYSLIGNLRVTEFHSIAYDANLNAMIGGSQDTGTHEQPTPEHSIWRAVTKADGGKVAVDDSDPDESIHYYSTQFFGRFSMRTIDTSDGSYDDDEIDLNVDGGGDFYDDDRKQFYQPFELNAVNPSRMVIGTDTIYESTDRGDHLTVLGNLPDLTGDGLDNDGNQGADEADEYVATTALAYGGYLGAAGNTSVLYVGTNAVRLGLADRVYVRTAGAGMPLPTATPFPGDTVRAIALDPDDWATAYVVDSNRVYQTPDAGLTWNDITGDLTGTVLRSVEVIPAAGFDAIVVGAREGAFITATTTPGQWLEMGTNLPAVPVWDMDYDAGDDMMVSGTLGRGSYILPDASTRVDGEFSGMVWGDVDGDGLFESADGEEGLAGTIVRAFDPVDGVIGNFDDSFAGSDITDASGSYSIDDLVPGEYYLQFEGPTEHAISPMDQGADDTIDSDPDRVTGNTGLLTVLAGGVNTENDAGMIMPDRFEQNDDMAEAADLGVLPGVHIHDLTISRRSGFEDDWYRLELLRPDDVDVSINFTHAFGNLDLEVTDRAGVVLASGNTLTDGEAVSLTGLDAGTYFVRVIGVGQDVNVYDIAMEPGAASSTRVLYVNDDATDNDFYTLAVGDDVNDGLSPEFPKATVQSVLDTRVLNVHDLVVIDTGLYSAGVVIETDDEGAAYAGTPDGSDFAAGTYRWRLNDADFNIIYLITFGGGNSGTGIYADDNAVDRSTNNYFRSNRFPGTSVAIRIDNGEADVIRDNVVTGSGTGTAFDVDGGVSVSIRGNAVSGRTTAIDTYAQSSTIEDNVLSASNNVIFVHGATATAAISGNQISGGTNGIYDYYNAAGVTIFGDNEIFGNTTGIRAENADTVIFGNDIHDNATGVYGRGTFGGSDWTVGQPNEIHDNAIGVATDTTAGTTIRFNRVGRNGVGILADNDVDIHHNVLFRNTDAGLLVDGGNGVDIANNTIYTPSGDGVRLENSSRDVHLANNIIWTEDGYDLNVATDSQVGFESDYNNLFASGTGKIVWWQKPFTDLFDWQVEADYDNHSIGFTVPDPALDDPQFVDLAGDDYHLSDLAGTSIDAGDPASRFDQHRIERRRLRHAVPADTRWGRRRIDGSQRQHPFRRPPSDRFRQHRRRHLHCVRFRVHDVRLARCLQQRRRRHFCRNAHQQFE